MLLKLSIWQDVEEYLVKRTDLVCPVGSCEQHGPSGPVGTDLIVAEELANELGEDRRALVAPALPIGVSSVHGAFPGTISVRPMTMLAFVRDLVGSVYKQGFKRFLFVNAHPSSSGVLQAALAQVHSDLPDARCLLFNWWETAEVRAAIAELFGNREGYHATPGELSLVRKFYPRGVLDLPPPERFEPSAPPPMWSAPDFRTRHPDGRVGSDPSLASGSAGDRLFVVALRALIEAHRRLVEEV
ncbi:MAG: creatininase family protein [Deltaproteobacteria bacterium]|nr:creatininase family protein [Deltaproteobacteria bacterium]